MDKTDKLYEIAAVLDEEPSPASFSTKSDDFELVESLKDYMNYFFKLEEEISNIDFEDEVTLLKYDLEEYEKKKMKYIELRNMLRQVDNILYNFKTSDL